MHAQHIEYNSIEHPEKAFPRLQKDLTYPRKFDVQGTIKLHGTNMSVCMNDIDGFYVQGRHGHVDQTIYDMFGFGTFVNKTRKEAFIKLFEILKERNSIDTSKYTITIFGEWCGENIQKGVALCRLTKRFVIFDAKITRIDDDITKPKSMWLDISFKDQNKCVISKEEMGIYNIYDFDTFNVTIDLENIDKSVDELERNTITVDKECPFAKHFGIIGTGEGIVWKHIFDDGRRWIFKTKGESHRDTKNSKLIPLKPEKVESIVEFVEKTCTQSRFDNAVTNLYNTDPKSKIFGKKPQMAHCKDILTWIVGDIRKDEDESMSELGIEIKELANIAGKKVAEYMRKYVDNL